MVLLAGLLITVAQAVTFSSFQREGVAVDALVEVWQQGGAVAAQSAKAPFTLPLTPGEWHVRVSAGPHFHRVERVLTVPAQGIAEFGPAVLERAVDLGKLGWREETPTQIRLGEIGALGLAVAPAVERLASYDVLTALRQAGGATFATIRHAGLPFDLAAARLVDGLLVTEDANALTLWSMLLDHGYRVAPLPGAKARVAFPCGGTNCLRDAVRQGRTIVSTGPTLIASREGNELAIAGWARQDRPDRLHRIELWAHNRVLSTYEVPAQQFTMRLPLAGDWVAVRLIADSGWALSHAFFAETHAEPAPITCQLKMVFPEIASQQQAGAVATIWSGPPEAPGAQKVKELDLERNELTVETPVTALVRIELADGRSIDLRPVDASGVRAMLTGPAPLDWSVYEEVLRRCRRVAIESRF